MRDIVRSGVFGAALAAIMALSPAVQANPHIVIEASSGKVLSAEDATRPWYPASLTKLMTAYVVFKAIEGGRVDMGTPVVVSPRALSMAPSKMGYPVGTMVTIDNALKMLIVKSANDIAVALAEGVSGSVENFAAEMNAQSRRLGMTQSRWVNPNGLPDPGQVTSARDMALLAAAIGREFPQYADLFQIQAIKSGRRVMRTHNALLYRYAGADGMKTGFICASGFNVVASAQRNGKRLITVVLGATSAKERAERAAELLEDSFTSWLSVGKGHARNLPPSPITTPADIREDVCGKKRRNRGPAAEDSDEYTVPAGRSDNPVDALLQQKRTGKQGAETGSPYLASTWVINTPVVVRTYTGPRRPGPVAAEPVVAAVEMPAPAPEAMVAAPAAEPEKPLVPPAAARQVKLGAIMQDPGATPNASAYAAPATAPVLNDQAFQTDASSGAILLPGAILQTGKGDRLVTALPGQIPRAPVDPATRLTAIDPAQNAGTTIVPMPPPRPRKIPKPAPQP
jgi:D-alanyl-D-alanine carboxypeptidase